MQGVTAVSVAFLESKPGCMHHKEELAKLIGCDGSEAPLTADFLRRAAGQGVDTIWLASLVLGADEWARFEAGSRKAREVFRLELDAARVDYLDAPDKRAEDGTRGKTRAAYAAHDNRVDAAWVDYKWAVLPAFYAALGLAEARKRAEDAA